MMTGTDDFARNCLQTSVPLMPGSMTSSRTMSAPERSNSASADGPSPTTVVSKPSLRSRERERIGQRFLVLHDQHTRQRLASRLVAAAPRAAAFLSIIDESRFSPAAAGSGGTVSKWAGIRRVNVDPCRVGSTVDGSVVVGGDVLDDRQPQPGCRRWRGSGPLSTRKNRSKTRSWSSLAMPMPRSVTAIATSSPRTVRLTEETGSLRRVGDGVLDQVRQGRHEQGAVALTSSPLGASAWTVMSAARRPRWTGAVPRR